MAKPGAFITALKQHKRWADAASVVSVVLVIGLLCVAAYLADSTKTDDASRIGMYIAMVGVVVVVCIWQAAAFIAASIELAVRRRLDEKGPWE
jgi:protein-S-isoprenylcysteine O-methyltransferase Ste14